MNTNKFLLVVLFLAFSTTVGRANLGETEAQCIARYGHEFDLQDNLGFDVVGDRAASFNLKTPKGSLLIKIIFLNGVASHESLSNADSARGLSEDEMKSILNLESAGLTWIKKNNNYHTDRSEVTYRTEEWIRSDGVTAKCWMSGKAKTGNESGEIELSTSNYASAQRELDKQNESR
jgi:hypothetical protein